MTQEHYIQVPLYWKSDSNGIFGVALCVKEVKTIVTTPTEFQIITEQEYKTLKLANSYHNLTPKCLTAEARNKCWEIMNEVWKITGNIASFSQNAGMDVQSCIQTVHELQARITTLFDEHNRMLGHYIQTVPTDFKPFQISITDLLKV